MICKVKFPKENFAELTHKAIVVALELRPHPITLEAEKFVAPHFVSGKTTAAQRKLCKIRQGFDKKRG